MRDDEEPTFEHACAWWPDITDIYTPIGWKDHLFRFNILWNGIVVAQPHLNKRTEAWKGLGLQYVFAPGKGQPSRDAGEDEGIFSHGLPANTGVDDGMVRQGWTDHIAPVLWSEWSEGGLLLRQEVFAHVPGGQCVERGDEPLFAWVRLFVHRVCPALPVPARAPLFNVQLMAPCYHPSMHTRGHWWSPDRSVYPRTLQFDAASRCITEPDGTIRMGWDSADLQKTAFKPQAPMNPALADRFPKYNECAQSAMVVFALPTREGSAIDVLIPMLPTAREAFEKERALGRERALEEADRFWSRKPVAAASVSFPEPPLNEAITRSLQFAEVVAERNPATGITSMLSASYSYANLWTTPASMVCTMLLDTLGCHEVAEKYLRMFRTEQGTVIPPGDCFELHPGYLSSPKSLTSVDWITDHGAILHMIAFHALVSCDERFAQEWQEVLVKGCDFIRYARRVSHPGIPGIMPAAVASDAKTRFQAVWADGWNYKGLTSAVKALQRIGHPRAAEFAAEAEAYRAAFVSAFRKKVAEAPTWTDRQGARHPLIPIGLGGDQPGETLHAFYLDTGPLVLVYSGLLPAEDPAMRAALLWFREGPQTEFYRRLSNHRQVPCLDHEISSCEPCYSWNVFHSHQLGDRERFLEGLYSLWAGAMSRKTFVSCETRGGITGSLFSTPLAVYLSRLAVVDDQWREDELHLLRLMPLAWLREDREMVLSDLPTVFGPMTLKVRREDAGTVSVEFQSRFRCRPRAVWLHEPPVEGLKQMRVNGVLNPCTGGPSRLPG
jgi:hypothetical protein